MSLTLCVLASSSTANAIYVASERTGVLIDAGLSARETARRMGLAGLDPAAVRAICVTHEHSDHGSGIPVVHRSMGAELYANSGTISALERSVKYAGLPWKVFTTGSPFDVGDLRFEPFAVPHDSYDPVGFVVQVGALRAGIVTDMGMATTLIREKLKGCHALVVEFNHDELLLRDANRPWSLKQRISGRQGHLSNARAAELVADVAGPQLRAVFLAHLSSDCNRPELALGALEKALREKGLPGLALKMTFPDRPSDVVRLDSQPGADG